MLEQFDNFEFIADDTEWLEAVLADAQADDSEHEMNRTESRSRIWQGA